MSTYQRAKNGVHLIQFLLIIASDAVTGISVNQPGSSDARNMFALYLSIFTCIALTYQTIIPSFSGTRRYANVYIHAIVDLLFGIFYLTAFCLGMSWVKEYTTKGVHNQENYVWCDRFANGPTSRCKLEQVSYHLCAVICALFAVALAFSIGAISHYRAHGSIPGYASQTRDVEQLANQGTKDMSEFPKPVYRFSIKLKAEHGHTSEAGWESPPPSYRHSPTSPQALLPERPGPPNLSPTIRVQDVDGNANEVWPIPGEAAPTSTTDETTVQELPSPPAPMRAEHPRRLDRESNKLKKSKADYVC